MSSTPCVATSPFRRVGFWLLRRVAASPLRPVLLAVFLLALPAAASAGMPVPPPPESPLVGLRVIAPPGAKATFYPDCNRYYEHEVPTQVAVRPGYIYRFRLSDLPQGKDVAIYPTVEVIGTLHLPPPQSYVQHPLPIVITEEDINLVLAGGMVTKLIVLEDPDRAVPVATDKDRPMETTIPIGRHLLEEGWLLGRPMAVVRIGERQADLLELHGKAIPGTMLTPGDPCLGPPAGGPCVPHKCFNVLDPKAGLRYPYEECLKDGGDVPPRAGFDPAGQLVGLDPKDTVAEYTGAYSGKHISVSNRVCVCVPRYVVLRTEIVPGGVDMMVGPTHAQVAEHQSAVAMNHPPVVNLQIEGPELLRNRLRPQSMQGAIAPVIYEQWLSTGVASGLIGPKVAVATCIKRPERPEGPLLLCKLIDKCCAEIGDVVTFTLKYANPGGQPIREVVVSDSLTGRLEYVPGSARSDRDAVFTTQENEVGSVILRWQLNGELPPGQSGVITFQAKIR